MREILWLIGLTFVPALELRASIPVGILKFGMNPVTVIAICVVSNIVLGVVFYLLLDTVIKYMRRNERFDALYRKFLLRAQKKIQRMVDRWGELGVAIFIGIPLPGSGVITGAMGSYAIGLKKRKFFIANVIGVLIAATIVTIVVYVGEGFVRSLFIKE